MWLRGDRAAVLSALALAMGGREPLPEALERLAQADPALSPWAARLAPPLRAGQALPALLRRWRLVDGEEAAGLEAASDQAHALRRIVDGAGKVPWLYHLMRWYPAWLVTTVAVFGLVAGLTIFPHFEAIYRELGIKLPGLTLLMFDASGWPLVLTAAVTWAACWLVAIIPGVRHLLHLTTPDLHHAAAWWRLVRAARRGGLQGPPSPWWQPTSPERDWSTWWLASRWRLDADRRGTLASQPLSVRLAALGVPAVGAPACTWDQVEADAHQRLERVVSSVSAVMNWQILILASLAAVVVALFLPLLSGMGLGMGLGVGQLNFNGGGGGGSMVGDGWVRTLLAWLAWLPDAWQTSLRDALEWCDDRLSTLGRVRLPDGCWLVVLPLVVPAVEWFWIGVRSCWPDLSQAARGRVGLALARCLRQRGDVQAELRALVPHLQVVWSGRVARAIRQLEGSAPTTLPQALVRAGIVPAALGSSGEAARSVGPDALASWCEGWAGDDACTETVRRALALSFWPTLVLGLVLSFIMVMIVPKFEQVMRELGIVNPSFHRLIEVVNTLSQWWWLLVPVGLAVAVALVALAMRWRWRRQERRLRGAIILRGAAAGLSEPALAASLADPSLAGAAAQGGFPALCRAVGWPAADPAGLARLLGRDQVRRARRHAWFATWVGIAQPLVLALPVALVVVTMFASLMGIVEALCP
jgi:hypothetical protein